MAYDVKNEQCTMLPSSFVRAVGVCLLIFGVYDTNVYWYALTRSKDTFDFFGHQLTPKHPLVKVGFVIVLLFYYSVGTLMIVFG
jgi:hypothetical protein